MSRPCDNRFKRRQKNSSKRAASALLGVEQLERRDVPSAVYWTGDAGTTNWGDAGNWSAVDPLISNVRSAILPGPSDNVIIDLAGVTVDHSAASQDVIGSLQVTGAHVTLNLSAGTLDLSGASGSGTFQVDQTGDAVNLMSVLKDATVTSGTTIVAPGTGGILDGVTLDGSLYILWGGTATIKNGLVLNGTIDVGASGPPGTVVSTPGIILRTSSWAPPSSYLTFDDSNGLQTLSTTGQGQIDFSGDGGSNSLNVTGSTLTIAAGVTINGSSGVSSIIGPINNFGSIDEDNGGTVAINFGQGSGAPVGWTNNGAVEVSSGTLELGGAWTNNGTITASSKTSLYLGDSGVAGAADPNPTSDAWVNNGTINTSGTLVYLGGYLTQGPTNFDPAALGLGADTVYLTGTLDNSSHTLTLTPGVTSATGTLIVSSGQIDGGTVDATAVPLDVSGGSLDGVTLDGTLDVLGASATIRGGLVLNGVIVMGDANALSPVLIFDDTDGPQTLSTNSQGSIDFEASSSINIVGSTLTIAAGITIQDDYPTSAPYFASQNTIDGPIDNFGNIDEDNGGIIAINFDQGPGSLYTWEDSAGALVPWTNNGTIEVSKGTLSLGGPWTNNGFITAGSGTTLHLGDIWVAPNAVDPNPTGDAWINNGTISTGGTNVTLGGNLTWSPTNLDLAALGLGADTVSILGTLDNSAHTLTMAPGVTSITGNWTLGPGQIDGGTIDETAAAVLVQSYGTLNGVTLINPPALTTPSDLLSGPSGAPAQQHDTVQEMGPNGRYVDLLYQRLLGRIPDVQGGSYFVTALDSGQATQAGVVGDILHSQEYLTREVTQLYQTVLGRAPDAGGLASSIAMLAAGASSTQLEAILLGSAEYFGAAGGTNAGFVSAVYQTVLGRKADAPGALDFALELVGGVSCETVAQQILASPEGASLEVQSTYVTILNRDADSVGLAAGSALLENGGSLQPLIVTLATSSEFAGQVNGDVGQLFVTQVYQSLLGRAPDSAALALGAGAIDAGTATRLQIVEEIQSSTEYRTDEVDAAYQEVLGRTPDQGGLGGSLAFLGQGGTLSQLEAMLLSSNEFFTAKGGGTDSGFLSALYEVALNRAVDSGGAQSFGQALAGGASRNSVVADVLNSSESQTLAVVGLYNRYLGRSADPGGLSTALAALQNGASLDQIAAMLIASPEYLDRL